MKKIFKNIKELIQIRSASVSFVAGKGMGVLPALKNAYLTIEAGKISGFGKMEECPDNQFVEVIDATDKILMPTWCDSHTHIVYAGNRENEFIDRIKGASYKEIAENGGGILNSAKKLQQTSAEDLYLQSKTRLEEVIQLGTGAVEIKSGYGLTVEAELKMLKVIKKLGQEYPLPVKSTFLAAHALPSEYKDNKDHFLRLMIDEVMPVILKDKLAAYVDVFCEVGYFTVADTELMIAAGTKHGLQAKIHVNQFTAIGGVQAGVKHNARSVDHLEEMRPEDIEVLRNTSTMPVALPSCSFFLGIPYTPARKIIDAGLPLALASDYNPGSTPSGNMNFVVSLACIKMKMTPEEAINAATINSAYAMGLEREVGSITIGKRANLIMTKAINSYGFIPYSFGTNCIEKVFLDGEAWQQ
ncbi:MAG: imidazolonepropionase [Arcticibacterium sp.]|jgi:imidazolonepropionase